MARLDWYIRANLKLRHLQLLVALDDLRHVGRVAAYLNVTQPAVSKTLAGLESGLQLALFERTSKGLVPTEHGTCLIRHARELLRQLSTVQEELRDITEGQVARVALGVLPSAAVMLVPRFLARLEARSAAVAVALREGTMNLLLPALRAGDIDFTVGMLPERSLGIEFASERLWDDPIVAAVRAAHPLVGRRTVHWDMMNGYPLILPPPGTYVRGALDELFAHHRLVPPRQHVDSLSTMTNVGTLQLTDSIGFLSRGLAERFSRLGLLKILPLSVGKIDMRIGLIWMAERPLTAAMQLTIALFRETCGELRTDGSSS
jgi:DNA-binding transcriptional LysR family regulator